MAYIVLIIIITIKEFKKYIYGRKEGDSEGGTDKNAYGEDSESGGKVAPRSGIASH